jgi:NAD-dependent protein deacetylase/lipoamidase
MSVSDETRAELCRALASVRTVAVITGAGISAESGIQPYRGSGGLYDDPEAGDATVEALTGTTLVADPDRTWRVVAELARQAGAAEPNAAHRALVELEDRVEHCVILTQNVDGLHRRAGSRNLIEIHGDVFRTTCMSCLAEDRLDVETLTGLETTPLCRACQGLLRPRVVLFGEMLPLEEVGAIHREIYQKPADLTLVVGTSALFPYITEPVRVARAEGRLTVEVDPEPTPLSSEVNFSLRGRAGACLPWIVDAIGASS